MQPERFRAWSVSFRELLPTRDAATRLTATSARARIRLSLLIVRRVRRESLTVTLVDPPFFNLNDRWPSVRRWRCLCERVV